MKVKMWLMANVSVPNDAELGRGVLRGINSRSDIRLCMALPRQGFSDQNFIEVEQRKARPGRTLLDVLRVASCLRHR